MKDSGDSAVDGAADDGLSRRRVLALSGSGIVTLGGIGLVAGQNSNGNVGENPDSAKGNSRANSNRFLRDRRQLERLFSDFKAAKKPAKFLKELPDKKRSALETALSEVVTETAAVESTSREAASETAGQEEAIRPLSTQTGTTTYTRRHRVNVKSKYLNSTLFYFEQKLSWKVENGRITSAIPTATGKALVPLWGYYGEVDPEYKFVRADGCSSTRSGIFKFCNNIEGYKVCNSAYTTVVTSNISGFPNGKSSVTDRKSKCDPSCPG